ncbi:MAG: ATP-binding cassette domain-containing protein [bacterium]|nr:ATP-binding cassette domain-containing protein [bacterium]
MPDIAISLEGVSHSYNSGTPIKKQALKNITICINKSETIGIMGPPGCGKTTLARLMAGMVKPCMGSITTPGTGPSKVGLLFQFPEHQLFCHTVFDDISYALKEAGSLSSDEIETAYLKACREVGLDPETVRDIRQSELSGGERRRVAIAAVLAMNPSVIILDEPTVGLDRASKKKVIKEIKRLSSEGCTLIIISHDIEDLLSTSERLVLMKEGKIACDGPAKEILLKLGDEEETIPMLPYVTELLLRLGEKGMDVRRDIYGADEAYAEIKRVICETS